MEAPADRAEEPPADLKSREAESDIGIDAILLMAKPLAKISAVSLKIRNLPLIVEYP